MELLKNTTICDMMPCNVIFTDFSEERTASSFMINKQQSELVPFLTSAQIKVSL